MSKQKIETNYSRVTLEELAGMVARGFEESKNNVNEKFDKIDRRFLALESRVDDIEENMATKDDLLRLGNKFRLSLR